MFSNVIRFGYISDMKDILIPKQEKEIIRAIEIMMREPDSKVDDLFLLCIKNRMFEIGLTITKMGSKPIEDETMNKAFMWACNRGSLEVCQSIYRYRVVDFDYENGMPLIEASAKGHTEIVKFLLRIGADPSFRQNSALRNAEINGHKEIQKLLKKQMAKHT